MRILILGCGSIGSRHAKNAHDLDAEVAVFDLNSENTKAISKALNVTKFDTLNAALSWQADGVVIATPHITHIDLATKAIEAGADLLIEKPISNTTKGIKTLLTKAKARGRHVSVVCNMRYHDAVMAMHQNMHKIGTVFYAKAQYGNYLPNMRSDVDYRDLYCAHKETGGGAILDVIHEIDYLTWLLGPVIAVNCVADKISNLDINVEDFASMILTHQSGARSSVHVDYLKPFKRRGCEIVGDKGMILWQSEGKTPETCTVKVFENRKQEWASILDAEAIDTNAGYMRLMQAFMKKIQHPNAETELSDGEQGFEVLKTALNAHQSANLGGAHVER